MIISLDGNPKTTSPPLLYLHIIHYSFSIIVLGELVDEAVKKADKIASHSKIIVQYCKEATNASQEHIYCQIFVLASVLVQPSP